jgi:hypothetical protein
MNIFIEFMMTKYFSLYFDITNKKKHLEISLSKMKILLKYDGNNKFKLLMKKYVAY